MTSENCSSSVFHMCLPLLIQSKHRESPVVIPLKQPIPCYPSHPHRCSTPTTSCLVNLEEYRCPSLVSISSSFTSYRETAWVYTWGRIVLKTKMTSNFSPMFYFFIQIFILGLRFKLKLDLYTYLYLNTILSYIHIYIWEMRRLYDQMICVNVYDCITACVWLYICAH